MPGRIPLFLRNIPLAGGTKKSLSGWHTCTAGGCGEAENLSVPKHLRTGTGAIRQELLINSRLSAPQTPGL